MEEAVTNVQDVTGTQEEACLRVRVTQLGDTVLIYTTSGHSRDTTERKQFISGSLTSKSTVELVLESNGRFIDYTGVLRFIVESEDLLNAMVSRTKDTDATTKKRESDEIRRRRLGEPVDCSTSFLLKNAQYGLYLSVNQSQGRASEAAWGAELTSNISAACLFKIKTPAKLVSPGSIVKYEFLLHLVSAATREYNYYLSLSNNTICIGELAIPWRFSKFEHFEQSDYFVKYLVPIRIKLKCGLCRGSNYYLSAESLEVKSTGDTRTGQKLILSADADFIGTHFFLVGSEMVGGSIPWNAPFHIVQAANLCYLTKDLVLSKYHVTDFTCRVVSQNTGVKFVPFNFGVQLAYGGMKLGINPVLEFTEAISLAVTFNKDNIEPSSLGAVVLRETGSMFEIEEVPVEDTEMYQGIAAILDLSSRLLENCTKTLQSQGLQHILQNQEDYDLEESEEDAVDEINQGIKDLAERLSDVKEELANAGVEAFMAKQKALVQIGIPAKLLEISVLLGSSMMRRWKPHIERKRTVQSQETVFRDESTNAVDEAEDTFDDDNKEDSETESNKGIEALQSFRSMRSKELDLVKHENGLKGLINSGHVFFDTCLELIFSCIKANREHCKKFVQYDHQLHSIFELNRGLIGSILAEIYTYQFPEVSNQGEYYGELVAHFSNITQENIKEQHMFTRMFRILMGGDTYESDLFRDYSYKILTRNQLDILSYKFAKMDKRLWITFEIEGLGYTYANQMKDNPLLEDLDRKEFDGRLYYALNRISDSRYSEYIEYIRQCMLYSCIFTDPSIAQNLQSWNNINTGILYDIIEMNDLPLAIKQGALIIYERLISLLKSTKSKYVYNVSAPKSQSSFSSDLVILQTDKDFPTHTTREVALQDLRNAARITLSLGATTASLPLIRKDSSFVEQLRFVSGLLRVSHRILVSGFATKEYIRIILSVVKTGLVQLSPRTDLPQNWFSTLLSASIQNARKMFDVKVALETLYDWLFKVLNAAIQASIFWQFEQFIDILRQPYSAFKSKQPISWENVVHRVVAEIIDPLEFFIWEVERPGSWNGRRTLSRVAVSPLPAGEVFDKEVFYSLSEFRFSVDVPMLEILDGLFIESTSFGGNFDQKLIAALKYAVSLPKTVISELKKLIIVDENTVNIANMVDRCNLQFKSEDISQMIFGTKAERIAGVVKIAETVKKHPFLSAADALLSKESLKGLQLLTSLNRDNLEFFEFFFEQLHALVVSNLESAQYIEVQCVRGVCLKFLTTLTRDNTYTKKLILKLLQPKNLSFILPEVGEFAKEFADFDYLTTRETEVVFNSLAKNLIDPDYWKAYPSYQLMRCIMEESEIEAQFLVVSSISEMIREPLKKLLAGGDLTGDELRHIWLSLLFLSDCASSSRITRTQIVKLLDLPSILKVMKRFSGNHGLLLSLLTFIDVNYRKSLDKCLVDILGVVLEIANPILLETKRLLAVIQKNVYDVVPNKMIVQHSGYLFNLSKEELSDFWMLKFLMSKSGKSTYGVIVAVPNILRRLVKNGKLTSEDMEEYLAFFTRLKEFIANLYNEEFDFSSLELRADQAIKIVTSLKNSNGTKKDKAQNGLKVHESTSVLKESFTEKLQELFPDLKKALNSTRLINSLASKIQGYVVTSKQRADTALQTLYKRNPSFPLKDFARVTFEVQKSLHYPNTDRLLKLLMKNNILYSMFASLGTSEALKTNVSVLIALNCILHHQGTKKIVEIKNALVNRSIDSDLLTMISQETKQALITFEFREKKSSISSFINSLGYLKFETYAEDSRRTRLINMHQKLVCNLLQLMERFCDNCNSHIQDYVRIQSSESVFNVNIVSLTTEFLFSVCAAAQGHPMSKQAYEYSLSAINAMIEFVTGPCPENQALVGNSIPMYLSLNKLMELPEDDYYDFTSLRTKKQEKRIGKITELRSSVTKLLTCLLEGNPDQEILVLIDKYLDKRTVVEHAKKMYSAMIRGNYFRAVETESSAVQHITQKVKVVLQEVCFLISFLQKFSDKSLHSVLETAEDRLPFFTFYLNYVGYVEIDMNPDAKDEDKADAIRDVFFVIPFKAKFLPVDSAEEVVTDVSHESQQDKGEDFLKSIPMRKQEMEHHQRIARASILQYAISNSGIFKLVSFLLVIAINIAIFITADAAFLKRTDTNSSLAIAFVLVLGVIQILCYATGAVLYAVAAFPKIVCKYAFEDTGMDFDDLAGQKDRESQRAKFREDLMIPVKEKKTEGLTEEAIPRRLLKGTPTSWQAMIAHGKNIAAVIYLAFSITALAFPMIYPLLLLQIFDHVRKLTVILQSITYNKGQLMYTAMFGVLLLYLMSIICFVWFSNYFNGGNGEPTQVIFCDTLWDCFTSTVHWGLLSGGGLGDALGPATKGRYWGRLVFDLLSYILIIVIMLNIIFGIIIDTFSELRDERSAVEADINSKCFVCGLDRNEIELHGKGWAYHFQNEHSPFAYLAFLVYLTDMNLADCSGVENKVKVKLEKKDITFMPTTSRLIVMNKYH